MIEASEWAVRTENLSYRYPNGRLGCQGLNLTIGRGRVFGLLGPNGAGKSTLVKMLTGLLRPTAGRAWIFGRPLGDRQVRRRMGFLPELFRQPDWLTGLELLRFHGALLGLSGRDLAQHVEEAWNRVGLPEEASRRRIGTYSKGMQQRLGLAVALLGDPDLLFLDEPTSALDPVGRRDVRVLLGQLREAGKTVFLNSHLISEVERTCDEIAIIRGGRVVLSGPVAALEGDGRHVLALVREFPPRVQARAAELLGPLLDHWTVEAPGSGTGSSAEAGLAYWGNEDARMGGGLIRVHAVLREPGATPALARALVAAGAALHGLAEERRSLEEIFMQAVNAPVFPEAEAQHAGGSPAGHGGSGEGGRP
ncbi:MAG: ABC transporter ATP-binding protein [Firmicutes bacterium]|nr:ABC transporter ATP-binding protein [Bacillota bacterium]